jgi:hypothetical protein
MNILLLFSFMLVLNYALLFRKLLVFQFLLNISEIFYSCSKNCASATRSSAANVVCRGVGVFGTKPVCLNRVS